MKPVAKRLLAATSALLINVDALAAAYTFGTPNQPLPATPGNGLTGQLWTNVAPGTDTLAQAQAIIAGGYATANFRATTIDYPVGATGSTSVYQTYGAVLDSTAQATLDNPSVLTDDVLDTVMRFAGFFGVQNAGEVWTFHIPSDDGSAVDIQGTRVLNNDGIHGFGGPSTTVAFTTPGLYAIDILFFESQPTDWGLEFRGGLGNATPATALTDRLYTLVDYATPGDDRLDSIQGKVPEPGTLTLLGAALLSVFGLQCRARSPLNPAGAAPAPRCPAHPQRSRPVDAGARAVCAFRGVMPCPVSAPVPRAWQTIHTTPACSPGHPATRPAPRALASAPSLPPAPRAQPRLAQGRLLWHKGGLSGKPCREHQRGTHRRHRL